jgi:hypothetical protein
MRDSSPTTTYSATVGGVVLVTAVVRPGYTHSDAWALVNREYREQR